MIFQVEHFDWLASPLLHNTKPLALYPKRVVEFRAEILEGDDAGELDELLVGKMFFRAREGGVAPLQVPRSDVAGTSDAEDGALRLPPLRGFPTLLLEFCELLGLPVPATFVHDALQYLGASLASWIR